MFCWFFQPVKEIYFVLIWEKMNCAQPPTPPTLSQFHQRYTRAFFVRIFQQSQNVTSKTTFVRNICTYNFDEIDTLGLNIRTRVLLPSMCQFHQHFTRAFFVQNFRCQNFKPKSQHHSFWSQNFVRKMLE